MFVATLVLKYKPSQCSLQSLLPLVIPGNIANVEFQQETLMGGGSGGGGRGVTFSTLLSPRIDHVQCHLCQLLKFRFVGERILKKKTHL